MRGDDLIRMHHMLDAAKEALSFARNKTRGDLDSERMLVLSIVKAIEIIGEAASKVTQETREALYGAAMGEYHCDAEPSYPCLLRYRSRQSLGYGYR